MVTYIYYCICNEYVLHNVNFAILTILNVQFSSINYIQNVASQHLFSYSKNLKLL